MLASTKLNIVYNNVTQEQATLHVLNLENANKTKIDATYGEW